MSTNVEGKAAIVTGGGSGLGQALVETLAAGGANVLAVDINAESLERVSRETGCSTRVGDISQLEENEAMIGQAVATFGRLDLAFLNAGVLDRDHRQPEYRAADLDLERYAMVRAINTDGVVYGSVAAAKAMAQTGGGGIVATASVAGVLGYAPTPMYSLSKAAVIGWVRAVGEAFAADGVHISAICPGGVATPMVGLDASAADNIPRMLAPADLAVEMIATACEDHAGGVFSVVAGREPVRQVQSFLGVPGFP